MAYNIDIRHLLQKSWLISGHQINLFSTELQRAHAHLVTYDIVTSLCKAVTFSCNIQLSHREVDLAMALPCDFQDQ